MKAQSLNLTHIMCSHFLTRYTVEELYKLIPAAGFYYRTHCYIEADHDSNIVTRPVTYHVQLRVRLKKYILLYEM